MYKRMIIPMMITIGIAALVLTKIVLSESGLGPRFMPREGWNHIHGDLLGYIENHTGIDNQTANRAYQELAVKQNFSQLFGNGSVESDLLELSCAIWLRVRGFSVVEIFGIWKNVTQHTNVLRLWNNDGRDWFPAEKIQGIHDFLGEVGHREWTSSRAFVVVPLGSIRQRVLETPTCAFQAAVLCLFNAEERQNASAEMIDLARCALHVFSKAEIEDVVIGDRGVKAEGVLKRFVGADNVGIGNLHLLNAARLNRTGSVLITNVIVTEDFDEQRSSYLGSASGNVTGLHAMLIIGVREEEGEKIFLVQNSRPDMQFVEMSESYLLSAEVTGYYYVKPGVALQPSRFVTSLQTAVSAVRGRVRRDVPRW